MKKTTVSKAATTWMTVMILLFVSISPTATRAATPEPAAYTEESEIADGARQFDQATLEIQSLLKSDLSTEKGVREAAVVIRRNEKKFAQVEKKALHAALRVAAFQKGLKDEAAKRKGGAEELARELEANHELIANIAGAEEAATAMRESTRPAAEALLKLSEALKKSANDAKAKNKPGNLHHPAARTNPEPEATGFCSAYPYICILLSGLAQYYLRQQVAMLAAASRKANCVLDAYSRYSACTALLWWDLGLCNSDLTRRISNCLLFA